MKKFILLIFLCLFCSPAYANISAGLVGWWKLNDDTGTTAADSSGSGNPAPFHNAPAWETGQLVAPYTGPPYTQALSFNGTNAYIQTTTATNIPAMNGTLTYSAWVHVTAIGAIMDVLTTTNGTVGNQLRLTATGYIQVSQWGAPITVTATTLPLTTTGWYMITWTSTGVLAGQALYVNGVACTVTTTTTPQTGAATSVVIASYDAGEYFGGGISDARIYNRVLTPQEVVELYNYSGKAGGFLTMNSR